MDVPPEFTTMRGDAGATRPIVVRPNLDGAETLLGAVSAVEWSAVHHAYGPASDVPGQLAEVIVGDDETRDEAWWNLWGNIHHQGDDLRGDRARGPDPARSRRVARAPGSRPGAADAPRDRRRAG
jgi:hypothetical protein